MRAEDLTLVSVDDHVVEPPDLFEGHLPDKWMEYAPKSVQPRRHRRVGLRGQRDPQHRAQRGRRAAARGVQHRAHELRDDAQGLLRHPRARQRHEPQRRARLDVLPVLRAVLRAAVLPLEGPRHGAQSPAGLQRLAHRRVVRHVPGPVHPAVDPADLGSAAHGGRGAARRQEGLPRGHVLGEPVQAGLAAHLRRPLGPVLRRLRGRGHDHLPAHRLVVDADRDRTRARRSTS